MSKKKNTTPTQVDLENQALVKSLTNKRNIRFAITDLDKSETNEPLEKSVMNTLTGLQRGQSIVRIGFTEDPTDHNHWMGIWKPKKNLLPDEVLKRIANQDSLVAAIWVARSNHISAFGRELQDRFATGFRIEPRRGITEDATQEMKDNLQKRIVRASKLLSTCGHTEGYDEDERMSLATFMYQQVRNAIIFGRFATEICWMYPNVHSSPDDKQFHSFRPLDAGTIYQAAPRPESIDPIRKRALKLLEDLKNKKLDPERFENDEYAWIEVINGQPRQAFTPEECVVHNIYPVTDYELGGYPVTPIDMAISDIITHLNITAHNKIYFQNGRASRGMIVIKSTDISQDLVAQIRTHFNASINNVNNAWRVPVFGIDPAESVEWEPLEFQGGRDMEFQYLYDSNARVILSAFQMSPEELPGYAHLSRGTNNQALSESNNEYKLLAARDVGIRPLLSQFQDFLNDRILPLLDPEVAKYCVLKLWGLDADTAEKESTRLGTDQAIHMTYDEVLNKVEKAPVGKRWGGEMPMNPAFLGGLKGYLKAGEIREHFFGIEGASQDPEWAFCENPAWMQWQQLLLQKQQMDAQAQVQQQQAQQPQESGKEGDEEKSKSGDDSEIGKLADEIADKLDKK